MTEENENSNSVGRSLMGISLESFLRDFYEESDRAAVILGVARLDSLLYELLRRAFRASPTADDPLFDGDAPLSTFNAKICVAYRLGLVDNEVAQVLHLIRKIRNAFAHESLGVSLQSGPQHNRLREFMRAFERLEGFELLKGDMPGEHDSDGGFRAALTLMVMAFEIFGARQLSLFSEDGMTFDYMEQGLAIRYPAEREDEIANT